MAEDCTSTGFYISKTDPIWLSRAMRLHKPARLTAICIVWHCSMYEKTAEDGWRMLRPWVPRQIGATSKEIGMGLRQLEAAGLVELKRRGVKKKPYWRIAPVQDYEYVERQPYDEALGGEPIDEMDQRLQSLNTGTRRKQRSESFRKARSLDAWQVKSAKGKIARKPK